MKRTSLFALIILLCLSFVTGCTPKTNPSATTSAPTSATTVGGTTAATEPTFMTLQATESLFVDACEGDFSDAELADAIRLYQTTYPTIVVDSTKRLSEVAFDMGTEVSHCKVARLSHVDDSDIEEELHGYIDLAVFTRCEGTQIFVSVDWWYYSSSNANSPLWSYLLSVEDAEGNSHWCYFRVDYSNYAL